MCVYAKSAFATESSSEKDTHPKKPALGPLAFALTRILSLLLSREER